MTDRNLDDLHPEIKSLCEQFLSDCKQSSLLAIITETWRDPQREDQLHAKGITKATSLTCRHCFEIDGNPASKAFDFAILDENNRMVQDGKDDRYSFAGQIAKNLGLTWGGDFTHPDYDHCEIL